MDSISTEGSQKSWVFNSEHFWWQDNIPWQEMMQRYSQLQLGFPEALQTLLREPTAPAVWFGPLSFQSSCSICTLVLAHFFSACGISMCVIPVLHRTHDLDVLALKPTQSISDANYWGTVGSPTSPKCRGICPTSKKLQSASLPSGFYAPWCFA